MKKYAITVLCTLIVMSISGCEGVNSLSDITKKINGIMPSPPTKTELKVSPKQICNEYDENSIMAKEKYIDSVVLTKGKLRITGDSNLASASIGNVLGVAFDSNNFNKLKKFKNGQITTIKVEVNDIQLDVRDGCVVTGKLVDIY